MKHGLLLCALLAAVLTIPTMLAAPGRSWEADDAPALPEFTQDGEQAWLNSPPLDLDKIRGDVALIHVWAFKCWNCYRSFPWLNTLHQEFGDRRFRIIGIHTPEFEVERDRDRLAEAMHKYAIDHPVMMDNDYAYWKALNNRFWPAWYLVDSHGRLRAVYIGETHAGDAQARSIERRIDDLLDEAN